MTVFYRIRVDGTPNRRENISVFKQKRIRVNEAFISGTTHSFADPPPPCSPNFFHVGRCNQCDEVVISLWL